MIYRVKEDNENLIVTPKEAIFRIYRDIRFSKDKTPYKNHVSAVIGNGGRKNTTDPGIYLELSGKYLRFYSGIYEVSKEQLERIRLFISKNLDEFDKLIKEKDFKKVFGTVHGEKNKRLSKEFDEVLKKQPIIANKQFYYFTEIDSQKILSKTLGNSLMKFYYAAKPMNSFLKEALK
jgi:uncharacterized protein (TIGR02453 family)